MNLNLNYEGFEDYLFSKEDVRNLLQQIKDL